GGIAVWLAARGLRVWGVDVSPVAIAQARDLAQRCGVAEMCRFDAVDLDAGLPPGQRFEVIVCHRFRDPRLDAGLADRLSPGGLLAIATLRDGPYGASDSELRAAFAGLAVIDSGQTGGLAWLLARRPGP
ncbi:MAG: class I SAM-dependent methyltransferase, partial [Mycobacterium sp.]